VVDFSAFRRTHYNHPDPIPIYQTGIRWMFRGMLHLIAYRIVNYNFIIPAGELTDAVSFAQLMLANFLLYLRVSGQFHIIIGLLHLFGFNLPETNHFFWLATSFTELWRRINIYWKDFMQKVFFYPLVVKMKRLPEARRLALAASLAFVATWALHVYQWFWLRGTLFINLPDIIFWTILAVLVLFSIRRENRQAKPKLPASAGQSFPAIAQRAVRAAGFFLLMSVLWYMWTSASFSGWWEVVRFVEYTPHSLLLVGAGILLLPIPFGAAIWLEQRLTANTSIPFARSAALVALGAGALVTIVQPAVITRLPTPARAFISDLRVQQLNTRDAQLLERGYYEDLTGIDKFNSDLWTLYAGRPADWVDIAVTEIPKPLPGSFLRYSLNPGIRLDFHGALFTTNEWGMRDLPYTLDKPADTFRIALFGSSRDMGSGVGDRETFENLTEERLNNEFPGTRWESLNFSIVDYSMLQRLNFIQTQPFFEFQPDLVVVVPHPYDEARDCLRHLYRVFAAGVDIPYPYLLDLLDRAGVTPGMGELEAMERLAPFGEELLEWAFAQVAEEIRAYGAVPVILNYPHLNPADQTNPPADAAKIRALAQAAGFALIELPGVYDGFHPQSIIVAPWDYHPNAFAHSLLAEAFHAALLAQGLLPLDAPP
jgi:hypothetical protein